MKSNWRVYTKKADFKAIGERFGIDQVMARIIRNRGLETDEQINMYLNGTVDDMHSPHLLKDADKCVDILTDKIHAGKKIHIIGDYDIDGICSIAAIPLSHVIIVSVPLLYASSIRCSLIPYPSIILSGTANVTSAPAAFSPL